MFDAVTVAVKTSFVWNQFKSCEYLTVQPELHTKKLFKYTLWLVIGEPLSLPSLNVIMTESPMSIRCKSVTGSGL